MNMGFFRDFFSIKWNILINECMEIKSNYCIHVSQIIDTIFLSVSIKIDGKNIVIKKTRRVSK